MCCTGWSSKLVWLQKRYRRMQTVAIAGLLSRLHFTGNISSYRVH